MRPAQAEECCSGPDVLALDFDGVLCEGAREYFETSRRTYVRTWPEEPPPTDALFSAFRRLRPVIESGWEMPLLLRAIVRREPEDVIATAWSAVRDHLLRVGALQGEALIRSLRATVDHVRREWIAADARGWLDRHAPYCSVEDLRRVIDGPPRTAVVTTKEGEFARRILDHWGIVIHDIEGKESGSHKCDNLRALISVQVVPGGGRPRLWFVEDRLETLRCVTTHPDLADVGLFLAAWGYNTAAAREMARRDPRIRLLELATFISGVSTWIC